MERITDPADPRIADYVRLRSADAAARRDGVFIAESAPVIRQALASGYRVRSLLVTPHRYADLGDVAEHVYVAEPPIVRAIAGFDVHRGALAAVERPPLPPLADVLARSRRLAVVEGVSDHENMGSLFRNAAAFGIDAVLLCPRCSDPLYRRSVRVSMGNVLHVPFTRIDPWPDALSLVRAAGFTTIALTPAADADAIDEIGPIERPAFLLGAEGPGLSPAALELAERRVRIPMARDVDSVNVATAAAIAFHRI